MTTTEAPPADLQPMFADTFEPAEYAALILAFDAETASDLAIRVLRRVLRCGGELVDVRDMGWVLAGRVKVGESKAFSGGSPFMHDRYSRDLVVSVALPTVDHMIHIRLNCWRYGKGGRVRLPRNESEAARVCFVRQRSMIDDACVENIVARSALGFSP